MSYLLNYSDGANSIVLTIGDPADTSTSLGFVPKGYPNYGEIHQENMLHLLENFAHSAAPANPVKGQIWYDTTSHLAKAYDGIVWRVISGTLPSSITAPLGPVIGQLWYDTSVFLLKYWEGTVWQPIANTNQLISAATFTNNTLTLTRPGGLNPVTATAIASLTDIANLQANLDAQVIELMRIIDEGETAIAFAIALG